RAGRLEALDRVADHLLVERVERGVVAVTTRNRLEELRRPGDAANGLGWDTHALLTPASRSRPTRSRDQPHGAAKKLVTRMPKIHTREQIMRRGYINLATARVGTVIPPLLASSPFPT